MVLAHDADNAAYIENEYITVNTREEVPRREDINETSSSESVPSFSFWRLNKGQKFLLIISFLTSLLTYMCMSIIAPFFPIEASTKGISDTISGWIFGIFALTQVVASPVFGKLITSVGSRFMFLGGIFFSSGCTIIFGMLTFVQTTGTNDPVYVTLCFVLRISLAIGCTAYQTASFAICAKAFPDHITTVFGMTEVFVGMGMMIGPAIGGILYAAGGFLLPFAVLGGVMLINFPLCCWLLPHYEDDESADSLPMWQLLKIPDTLIYSLAIIVASTAWAVLDPTLEKHLNDSFSLAPEIVGLMFLLLAASYAIFCPISGWVADKLGDNRILMIPGFLLTGLSLMLLGPSVFLGFPEGYNQLWLNILALMLLGIGVSMAVVPTFDIYLSIAEAHGIEQNMETYGAVAGLWGGMYALGEYIGPVLGGSLYVPVGFPMLLSYVGFSCCFIALLLFLAWAMKKCKNGQSAVQSPTESKVEISNTSGERTPLLMSCDASDSQLQRVENMANVNI